MQRGGRKRPNLLHAGAGEFPHLFQHFRVLRKLGSGNDATVYQAQRLADGLQYALKQVDIQAVDPAHYGDLVNEIRLMASVDHPNLLSYFEAFVDGHQLFIVSELAPGGDLGTLLGKLERRREGLPETKVWSYFLQLAAALQYLHANRVLHRDVKPENVLLAEGGRLQLGDMGVSEVLGQVFSRKLVGTPQYVAPEMWRGQAYSFSADVWALGCVLHELITRRPLFLPRGRPTDEGIRRKVLDGRIVPISKKYSADLWVLIKRLLAPDPATRPTLDEIWGMEMVRVRMHLLPPEVRRFVDRTPRPATMPRLFRISVSAEKWAGLNDLLPPAKYKEGLGVAEAIRRRRRSSCPDIGQVQEEDEELAAAEGQRAGHSGGGDLGGDAGSPSLFRYSAAYPVTKAWAASEALRRQSMSVGQSRAAAWLASHPLPPPQQQQQPRQQQQEGQPQEQQQEGGSCHSLRRCKSLNDALRAKPAPPSAIPRSPLARQWGFDPSPLQFGSPQGSAHPLSAIHSDASSVQGASSYYEASYHGGNNNRRTPSYCGSSVHGASSYGAGSYYDGSYHGSYHAGRSYGGSSYGGSFHSGGAYWEDLSYHGGGTGTLQRAGQAHGQAHGRGSSRMQPPPPPAATARPAAEAVKAAAKSAGGSGLKAKLKRLFGRKK